MKIWRNTLKYIHCEVIKSLFNILKNIWDEFLRSPVQFTASVAALIAVIFASQWYFDRDVYKIRQLEKLFPGADIDYFKDTLNKPAIPGEIIFGSPNGKKIKEYIFIDKSYYVQAVYDDQDRNKVLFYSITTRKAEFNPEFTLKNFQGNKVKIFLGKTKFSELDKLKTAQEGESRPQCEPWVVDPKTNPEYGVFPLCYYSEIYDFGGKNGNHQSYGVSLNETGYPGATEDGESFLNMPTSQFRKTHVINTYTVSMPLFDLATTLPPIFGPDIFTARSLEKENK